MQNWFVVVMGLVTVFVVLILIIGLCWLLGLACRGSSKKEEMQAAAAAAPAPGKQHSQPRRIPCRRFGSHCRGQRYGCVCNSHSFRQEAVKTY